MSSISPHPEAGRIEDEAAVWAARLRGGGMTDADRALLTAWLERDPEHQWVLSRYRALSGQLDEHFVGAAPVIARQTKRRQLRRNWGVGLAAAAAVILAAVIWTRRADEFTTKISERHVATLADGSRVELNAQTALTVDLTRSERHVRLTRGEALFTVAKDLARPFIVETPAGVVRVTGTIFNVRATAPERAEVTVVEGHVRVRAAAADKTHDSALDAGNQAMISGAHVDVRVLAAESVQDVIAWRRGEVVFNDTPLREAMERFGAYHTRAISVGPDVADIRVGGRYSLDDLDGALEAIERMLPVRVERGAAGAVRIVAAGTR
jgi:transmembrane sensor